MASTTKPVRRNPAWSIAASIMDMRAHIAGPLGIVLIVIGRLALRPKRQLEE
jgi:hypothetical protein